MYPPSPPRFCNSRPAVVPASFGETTSRKVSPMGKTALRKPYLPTPGSSIGIINPQDRRDVSASGCKILGDERDLPEAHLLAAAEDRLTLLNERAHRVSIIVGRSAVDVVRCLQIETVIDLSTHGAVEIFFHITIGDARTARQSARDFLACAPRVLPVRRPSW